MPPLIRSVTFESDRFETSTPGSDAINADCFGADVAAWLRTSLPADLEPDAPIQEDYGWGLWTRPGEDPYWIAIGLMEEGDDRPARTWLVTAAYDPGLNLWRRLFHRPRRADLDRVCRAIDDALHAAAGITAIRWWADQPFMGRGQPHP
ncbi:MAG TPA: hypothetical protein VEB59_03745 [Gemmatimonadales bacterium]|nr:hypothetical protein [Gemmatimonadales bacterium]